MSSTPPRPTTPCSSARSGVSGASTPPLVACANTRHCNAPASPATLSRPVAALTIEKDANGDPTGVFIENGMQPTAELIWFREATEFTRADRAARVPLSAQAYHAFGTTSVFEEHGIANEVIRAYKDAWRTAAHHAFGAGVQPQLEDRSGTRRSAPSRRHGPAGSASPRSATTGSRSPGSTSISAGSRATTFARAPRPTPAGPASTTTPASPARG